MFHSRKSGKLISNQIQNYFSKPQSAFGILSPMKKYLDLDMGGTHLVTVCGNLI